MIALYAIFILIVGLCVGSFLNVIVHRFGHASAIVGRSHCPQCHHQLAWFDLIPLVSFIWLQGKCRYCGRPISPQYLLIEILTGLMFVLIAHAVPTTLTEIFSQLLQLTAVSFLIILLIIDYHSYLLPDIFIIGLTVSAVGLSLINSDVTWLSRLSGAALGAGFLGILWLVTQGRGIGVGDIKLLIPLGLWWGITGTIVLLWLAFVSGGLIALYLLWQQKARLKTAIPFGPFLIAAAFLLIALPTLPEWAASLWIGQYLP